MASTVPRINLKSDVKLVLQTFVQWHGKTTKFPSRMTAPIGYPKVDVLHFDNGFTQEYEMHGMVSMTMFLFTMAKRVHYVFNKVNCN